jgi:hypothetical protein
MVAREPPPPREVRDDDGVYPSVHVYSLELPAPVFCQAVAEEDGREVRIWLWNYCVVVVVVEMVAWRNTPSDGRPGEEEAHPHY